VSGFSFSTSSPALLEQIHHALEVGITRAEAAREPVPTASCDHLVVCEHLELTGSSGLEVRIDVEALLDEGRETRSLGLVVLSGWAVVDLDLHSVSNHRGRPRSRNGRRWSLFWALATSSKAE
jgi:hypothetical protein